MDARRIERLCWAASHPLTPPPLCIPAIAEATSHAQVRPDSTLPRHHEESLTFCPRESLRLPHWRLQEPAR